VNRFSFTRILAVLAKEFTQLRRDRPGLEWRRADANLEDVFISLIGQAQDNYAGKPLP